MKRTILICATNRRPLQAIISITFYPRTTNLKMPFGLWHASCFMFVGTTDPLWILSAFYCGKRPSESMPPLMKCSMFFSFYFGNIPLFLYLMASMSAAILRRSLHR